ncbi:MAG: aminotransferase class V-fold PLP-dependent enzyme, partial [bacterium]|nr:aminotransferase class V-fold PLP-dependent enzyme [bacterium]
VRSFEKLIRPNTKLIICTHASNVTGHILPIKEIGEMCSKNNILFAVDAAQTAGILPIDMQKMHIDYLCVAPHKGLYSPMGIGILIAEKDLPKTVIEGGTGTESVNIEQPADFPERMESGTVNVPGIAGVSAGIDFINRIGIERIYSYELMLAQKFYRQLQNIPGVKIYTPYPKAGATVPTISFNFEGALSSDIAIFLSERNIAVRSGLHCSPMAHKRIGTLDDGTVRVCFSYFNTEYDVEMIVRVLRRYKSLLKI